VFYNDPQFSFDPVRFPMTSNRHHLWRVVTIINELGLHARSAAKLAKAAQQAQGRVWIETADEPVDAKQIIDILTLGAARGDQLRVGIETPDDLAVLEVLVDLFASGFGE
jgi:phosphocarrier protein HPr